MELLLLLFALWGIGKGVKTLFRSAPRRTKANPTKPAPAVTTAFQTLQALQEQRDSIRNQFNLLDDSLNTLRNEYRSIQLAAIKAKTAGERDKARKRMITLESKLTQIENKRTSLYGRLATVESKISKLIY